MNAKNTKGVIGAVVVVLAVVVLAVYLQPAQAQREGEGVRAMGKPHYTVVYTEGHNLIVTDNLANTLFFYTIDKDKPIGSELKLRGSVDLNQVGKPEIKPVTVNLEKPKE